MYGEVTLCGRSALVYYEFSGNQLNEAFYAVAEEHANRNLYIDDFYSIKALLAYKYGQPQVDQTIWENEEFKDDRDNWGFALACGDVTFYCSWDTPRTKIDMILTGHNFEVDHFINYESKTISPPDDSSLENL